MQPIFTIDEFITKEIQELSKLKDFNQYVKIQIKPHQGFFFFSNFAILTIGDLMDSNIIIEKEKQIIDDISDKYDYDSNIRHLLYVIIPAFIIKYGIQREKLILNTFKTIKIVKSNKINNTIKAFYSSTIKHQNNTYTTKRYMVIQNYNQTSLVELLDNLVHEFNHALNSVNNEIKETNRFLYLRTGLTYRIYKKEDLSFIKKEPSYLLEEIINTKQTEDIINIIKSFDQSNSSIGNTIYAINSETQQNYNSKSYFLESYICKQILTNRTFINTLENLRITGDIYDIDKWFDDIIGKKGSYQELIYLLNEIYKFELEYIEKKYFKFLLVNKIKNTSKRIMTIVETFNSNVNYR